jgi:hypothetical protein
VYVLTASPAPSFYAVAEWQLGRLRRHGAATPREVAAALEENSVARAFCSQDDAHLFTPEPQDPDEEWVPLNAVTQIWYRDPPIQGSDYQGQWHDPDTGHWER